MLPLVVVALAAALVLTWLIGQPFYIAHRRRQIQRQPFPDAWRKILRRHVPYFAKLPADIQLQLKKLMQVFIAEKKFVGCNGLIVTDDMRVTIAAYACLLILNRRTDYYPSLRQILIYPGAFIVDKTETDRAGVLRHERQILSGESWTQGQVILSWEDTVDGALEIDDGHNVVIHEFAHQLDMESGDANGAPLLDSAADYQRWSTVLNEAFNSLTAHVQAREFSLLDQYGATNPAEFFAVASEAFFERPQELATELPRLYGELKNFYRVDPASWI
jgi:Mlc titration factor MtfA (ptsG expression regulator)